MLPFTHILVHLFDLHPPHPLFTGFPPTHTYACRHGHGVYEVIDPRVVANAEAGGGTFFIAYEADPSDSGKIHSNVRQKWMDGDEETTTLMSQFATITDDFKTAVEAGDMGRVSSLMADNFALRTFIIGLLNRLFNATRTYFALRRSNASNASNACLFEWCIRRSWMSSVHVFRPSPIAHLPSPISHLRTGTLTTYTCTYIKLYIYTPHSYTHTCSSCSPRSPHLRRPCFGCNQSPHDRHRPGQRRGGQVPRERRVRRRVLRHGQGGAAAGVVRERGICLLGD